MKAPTFYSDPHVQFLSQLLEEIGAGGLQVPRFQRPLVWNWERRLELLRSIRDGIPIGAIMVWRTNTVIIDCYDKLGPYKLRDPAAGMTRQYVLDGVQRLSTLYGALYRATADSELSPLDMMSFDDALVEDIEDPEEVGLFDVFYDPAKRDFVSPTEATFSDGPLMPISVMFDSISLLRFQRSLADSGFESLIKSTDEVARAFRDYKLPVIPITTDDINLATRTFQRINSQGAPMSETHMVHALTWNTNFDLQIRLSDLKSQVLGERGWAGLDDDTILKACKAAYGLDVYKASADELSKALVNDPDVLDGVFYSIARAADFLWNDCGIGSPDLVPYALQIVVLAEAFRVNFDPSERVRELLRAWFYVTTYGELFASMSGDRVQLAIADMHFTVVNGIGKWTWKRPFEERPLRSTFDFRAARTKAFAFRLAAIRDAESGDRRGTQILADAGRKALAQTIPQRVAGRAAFSSPGNRFLVAPAELPDFRAALLNGHLSSSEARAHGISNLSAALLLSGDYEGFVRQRAIDVSQSEHEFLEPLLREYVSNFSDPQNLVTSLDDIIEMHNVRLLHREGDTTFVVLFGSIATPVGIELRQFGDYTGFSTSHAIQTPLQASPYWTSRPFADTPAEALERAISGIAFYYDQAVQSGYQPSASWLVPSQAHTA